MRRPKELIDTREIVEDSHVVSNDDSQSSRIGECTPKIFAVALNRDRYCCRIDTIRAVAHPAAATTGTEWKNLPKGIKQQIQAVLVQMLLQELWIGERDGSRHPRSKAVRRRCTELSE